MRSTSNNRFVQLPGSLNFRDFGGYATADGGHVKMGKLFRCGALNYIKAHNYSKFAALNIDVICDLRREEEAEQSPSPSQPPFDVRLHIPIEPGSTSQLRSSFDQTHHDVNHRIMLMEKITCEIAINHVDEYKKLFHALTHCENAFLLHCTAGKDRTGFGAAMILSALGVSESDIFQDYLLTNEASELFELMRPMFDAHYGQNVDDENLKVIAGVQARYLSAALSSVKQKFGSIASYLAHLGMDAEMTNQLKRKLIKY